MQHVVPVISGAHLEFPAVGCSEGQVVEAKAGPSKAAKRKAAHRRAMQEREFDALTKKL